MRRRQPVPTLWLMTDERLGERLEAALRRLPRGSGVVFRHHATAPEARRRLYEQVRRIARRRRLVLVLAGPARLARGWRADGWHGRQGHRTHGLIRTAPAHDGLELRAAIRAGADAVFLSPVFPTRSHPDAPGLGPVRFGLLAGKAEGIVALGGMDAQRFRRVRPLGAAGWAAIDALTR